MNKDELDNLIIKIIKNYGQKDKYHLHTPHSLSNGAYVNGYYYEDSYVKILLCLNTRNNNLEEIEIKDIINDYDTK